MDEKIDPERLAAFLEGRLDARERADVLRILASSGEAYESFADAAAVLSGHDEATARERMAPKTVHPARHFLPYAWTAGIGVALAGLVLLIPLLRHDGPLDPYEIVAAVPFNDFIPSVRLADWPEPKWPASRGDPDSATSTSIAFRAGYRFVDLELAVEQADTVSFRIIRSDLGELVGSIDGSLPFVLRIEGLSVDTERSERRRLADEVRQLAQRDAWYDLGAWTEGVRFARSLNRIPAFDRKGRGLARIHEALTRSGTSADLDRSIRALLALLEDGVPAADRTRFDEELQTVIDLATR